MPRQKSAIAESHEAVADHLFCSVQRVREMVREDILPEGVLDIDDSRRRAFEWLRNKASGKAPKTAALEEARGDSLRIDIERKRLELDELRGELVRIPAVEKEWTQICLTMRTIALTAPSRCAGLVPADTAPVVQDTVKGVILQMLREMAHGSVPAERRAETPRGGKPKRRKSRGA